MIFLHSFIAELHLEIKQQPTLLNNFGTSPFSIIFSLDLLWGLD